VDIRWLKPEEYDAGAEQLKRISPETASMEATSLVGAFEDGKLVGVIGLHFLPMVGPLAAESWRTAESLAVWMDSQLSKTAYGALVRDERLAGILQKKFSGAVTPIEAKFIMRGR